jgi:hypothetical protein
MTNSSRLEDTLKIQRKAGNRQLEIFENLKQYENAQA